MSYADWIAAYEFPPQRRIALRRRLLALPRHPLISILLPTYNAEIKFLTAAIDSVRAQLYSNWQLCIADDASTDEQSRPYLEQLAASDPRIQLIFRKENGHIAAASNSALALETGEWCALLDQDDLLSEDALAELACEIIAHPKAALVYSDEDKINEQDRRFDPFFKPDWNPELFLGQNYLNHLSAYQTALLRDLGGFRDGFEGSQDYDLALRVTETVSANKVRHIPRILYHWRAAAGSLAATTDAKPGATDGARRALSEHLSRRHIAAEVTPAPDNPVRHRVVYTLPSPAPLVSAIIPMRDRVSLLKRCLAGLQERTDYQPIELVIVDHGSTEKPARNFLDQLRLQENVQVVRQEGPFNFSRLINAGAGAARGEILALLNNDTEADGSGWLREMVSQAVQSGVGAVGARLWFQNRTLQHGGVILGLGGMGGHAFTGAPRGAAGYFDRLLLAHDCSAVTAACMVIKKEVFHALGGFDEEQFGVNYNDVDFCLRLRAQGWRVIWTPHADLVHHESASRGRLRSEEADAQFYREAASLRRKWGAELLSDPFYNPNFSLTGSGYDLAFPPRVHPARSLS